MASATSETNNMLNFICDILNFTVAAVGLVEKVPQVLLVFNKMSSQGLSLKSLMLELSAFTVLLTYQCGMGYPITTYLEFCFLVPQDLILLYLVLKYSGKLSWHVIPAFLVYLAVAYMMAFRLIPDILFTSSISFPLPLAMSSKLLQIWSLLQTRDSGTVNATTWAMATYTASARVLTTLVQTGDIAVLTTYAVNTLLNATMTTLVLKYKPKRKAE